LSFEVEAAGGGLGDGEVGRYPAGDRVAAVGETAMKIQA
jgi:hypothetical protein